MPVRRLARSPVGNLALRLLALVSLPSPHRNRAIQHSWERSDDCARFGAGSPEISVRTPNAAANVLRALLEHVARISPRAGVCSRRRLARWLGTTRMQNASLPQGTLALPQFRQRSCPWTKAARDERRMSSV